MTKIFMKMAMFILVLFLATVSLTAQISNILKADKTGSKLRVVISTDFPPLDVCMSGCAADHTSDPDDVQEMVRFLLYANDFDVEGLIASSATFANIAKKQNILDILNLYAQVYQNLKSRDPRYPTPDYLRSVTFQGRSGTWGGTVSNNIGLGKDSEASDSIISIVDKPDPRPIWFCFWGDCSNLAQAIWKVKNMRSAADLQKFLSKIRIYQIAHQDDTIDWLMNNFPNLFIIYSKSTWQGMFGGPSDSLGNLTWLNAHIRQNHGPLGAVYPPAAMGVDGMKEGDSPSFLYLVSAIYGINNPEDPTQENWGGQYVRSGTTNHWVDGPGPSSVHKWESEYQADFALRADWMISETSVDKPHLGQIPKHFELEQNYPNPFNPTTQISYSVPNTSFFTLKVYNILGQEVKSLFEGFQNPGNYKVTFNASKLTSGAYLYIIHSSNFSLTKKMILMK